MKFTQSGILIKHKGCNAREKLFKCDLCEKGFNETGKLTIHKQIHTGAKIFKCDLCEKGFNVSGNLNRLNLVKYLYIKD